MRYRFFLFASVFLAIELFAQSDEPEFWHRIASFTIAKRVLTRIHADQSIDFYCGCAYASRQLKGQRRNVVDQASCGFFPQHNTERSRVIEWEHVVPAHEFGGTRACWRVGHPGCKRRGRGCCRHVDRLFRTMEADLHNLRPAIGEINQDRAHFAFGIISGEERRYGRCDFEVDGRNSIVEPRPEIRGDIARTYFYMRRLYGLNIAEAQARLFETWNDEDPVDEWERERNRRITRAQGNSNPYVN